MSKFEVIRGVKDYCLALDAIIHAWESDEEYKAVDAQSRWQELFGTPERAARTIVMMMDKCSDRPHGCDGCMLFDVCDDEANALEWLMGDAE